MHPISTLIASHVSTSHDRSEMIRAMKVADRAIKRLPDHDSAMMSGIVAAYNIAYLSSVAIKNRLDGDINYALRCEHSRDRLLEDFNL